MFSVITSVEAVFGAEGWYSGLTPQTTYGTGEGALSLTTGVAGAVVVPVTSTGTGN